MRRSIIVAFSSILALYAIAWSGTTTTPFVSGTKAYGHYMATGFASKDDWDCMTIVVVWKFKYSYTSPAMTGQMQRCVPRTYVASAEPIQHGPHVKMLQRAPQR